MSDSPSRNRRTICLVALGLCLGGMTAGADEQALGDVTPSLIRGDQTPADFLDIIGQRTKARWRLLFRGPPPTPPTDRGRAALILGSLMADSFLIWQAGDSQQFRNNNQEVLSYCRTLGLGEKLLPRLMAQGKMAESNEWKELRHEIVDSHQVLIRMLREQKDDDLAVLIDLGLWLRLLEIVSTVVVENATVDVRPLCIGSPVILQEIRDDFNRLSLPKKDEPLIKHIGTAIEEISVLWRGPNQIIPSAEQVTKTHDKLQEILQALEEK
ncbi:hypothetical protein [Prosthecobacter sp.]|uniref:hypothetical protein n=1 Tax=Prosthecobacter sp. TaxID=1965333 RepID=UPI0024893294|nr:hypothetical protein [Prosthecobacter sp.]MDI1311323.1 hypothetical protein [Prosthecobacter sp.]